MGQASTKGKGKGPLPSSQPSVTIPSIQAVSTNSSSNSNNDGKMMKTHIPIDTQPFWDLEKEFNSFLNNVSSFH
jgi:hypothetical protein